MRRVTPETSVEMRVTPEIRIYRAMINGAIEDSLLQPIFSWSFPEYTTTNVKSAEYRSVRDKRRLLREKQYWQASARHDLMELYMERLYMICYGAPIDGLRKQLTWMWEEIDKDPSKSNEFLRKFNKKAGHARGGGMKRGQKKRKKEMA